MKKIFLNKYSMLRSGWKILILFISFFVGTFFLSSIFTIFYTMYNLTTKGVMPNFTNQNSAFTFFINIIQCLCMIFFVVLYWKVFDKKSIKEIGLTGLRNSYKDLLLGLLFGCISLVIVFLILFCTKNVKLINPINNPNLNFSLLSGLILFILVGINEEMFARGYCYTVLKQTNVRWLPMVLSSVIFALMHSLNSGISLLSYLNLFLFGVLAVYMRIKSNNIWLSIGYHITWNYFEGNIFGFLVSGQATSALYNLNTPVNNLINGGNFGPEGGLVVTLVLILQFIFMWRFYKVSEKSKVTFFS
jgi:membrane protease YdiL (CAAX protease family)